MITASGIYQPLGSVRQSGRNHDVADADLVQCHVKTTHTSLRAGKDQISFGWHQDAKTDKNEAGELSHCEAPLSEQEPTSSFMAKGGGFILKKLSRSEEHTSELP